MSRTQARAEATAPPSPAWDKTVKATNATVDQLARAAVPPQWGSSDLAIKLPPAAARKLEMLRTTREELGVLAQDDIDKLMELQSELAQFQSRRRALTDPASARRTGQSFTFSVDHPAVQQCDQKIAELTERLAKVKEVMDARSLRRQVFNRIVTNAENYLKAFQVAGDLAAFESEAPPLLEGETIASAVERLRTRRRELLSDLKSVRAAPLHSSVVKELARKEIEALAERGRPDVYHLLEGGNSIRWPTTFERLEVNGFVAQDGAPSIIASAGGQITDPRALIAALFTERLIEVVEAEIDAAADDAEALSDEERIIRSLAIRADLLAVERVEEAFIEKAPDILRRADADVRAVLGIVGPDPKEK